MKVGDPVYLLVDPENSGVITKLNYDKEHKKIVSVAVRWDSNHDPNLDGWCFVPSELIVKGN